jgi:hypothetical protein
LMLEIQLSKEESLDPINRFKAAPFCAYPKPGNGFPTSYVLVFLYIQWVKVRCDCSFWWCWWNCWPYFLFAIQSQWAKDGIYLFTT